MSIADAEAAVPKTGGRVRAGNDEAATPSGALDGLKTDIVALIEATTDAKVQVEASRLLAIVIDLGRRVDSDDIELVRAGLTALRAKSDNIRVAKFVRNRLEIKSRNAKRGFIPWLSRKLGDSAVYAMLVGVVVSAGFWVVGYACVVAASQIWTELFDTKTILPLHEASTLAFAALLGALVSVLSRVNQFASLYIFDPVLIFVNSLLKPLIGTVLALTVFAVLQSGIIRVGALTFPVGNDQDYRYIYWAFGFVAGFSERLAGDFIARTESVITSAAKPQDSTPTRPD